MINQYITELIRYGIKNKLIDSLDEVYTTNKLVEFLKVSDYEPIEPSTVRPINEILDDILSYCLEVGILDENTTGKRDLLDTKIMGLITPNPSHVIREFNKRYEDNPQEATEWYYSFSKATNYIRTDRVIKDEKWQSKSQYGDIDITINLSKPEKDPRDIAAAGKAKSSGYPKCLLCIENEGFAGNISHPARQNHRIIPITLAGCDYALQYSPYTYYNEHCIILNKEHIPMKIDRDTFNKLLSFTELFPHYIVGSNADLPIVGGSILSHDHFQGGNYEFPMARAEYKEEFTIDKYPNVRCGIVNWPMSVIRISSEKKEDIVNCSDYILNKWREYSDKDSYIFSHTGDTPHNTITPIARIRNDRFEMDLVLRNNITTKEFPMGVYHPHPEYHHIKKENIGLIEVMGLAILPARLKTELALLEGAILSGDDISSIEAISKHAKWAEEIKANHQDINENSIHRILRDEIGKVFVSILENAGVYKNIDDFRKFTTSL
ncbi:MAG: UDP-glucose--hexose-1-phosphate uridylyltransferase [Saccharofermentans sp.]|nr:UDP-glucose--hexose-1-phosphate uridylyltransferase [Saccharofermentans sp.]